MAKYVVLFKRRENQTSLFHALSPARSEWEEEIPMNNMDLAEPPRMDSQALLGVTS